jgi:hypothetical protein
VIGGAEVSAESTAVLGELRDIFRSLFEKGLIQDSDPEAATGDAGSIALQASQLVHLDAGAITTSSPGVRRRAETSRSTRSS